MNSSRSAFDWRGTSKAATVLILAGCAATPHPTIIAQIIENTIRPALAPFIGSVWMARLSEPTSIGVAGFFVISRRIILLFLRESSPRARTRRRMCSTASTSTKAVTSSTSSTQAAAVSPTVFSPSGGLSGLASRHAFVESYPDPRQRTPDCGIAWISFRFGSCPLVPSRATSGDDRLIEPRLRRRHCRSIAAQGPVVPQAHQ